jgi:ubiquinone/menaquinone biosynthesis C-methylase UbiE
MQKMGRGLDTNYVLGDTSDEIERLKIQSSLFEPITRDSLQKGGIRKGMACCDIGCGPGEVTRMMGDMVGKNGRVVGFDINENYIKYCKASTKQKNISYVCDNIITSKDLPVESFDIVYSRFMFVHLSDKANALRHMVQITKKNGTIIVQELDHAPDSWLSYPKRKSVDTLRKLYVKLVKNAGGDPYSGRKLYQMFVDQDLDSKIESHSPCLVMGREPFNSLGWKIALSLQPQILSLGLMGKKEFTDMVSDLKEMSKDPHSFVLYARLFTVVGKKH